MNRYAFEHGMLLELEKLGVGGNPNPSPSPAPSPPPAPVGMGAPRLDRAPSKFRAGTARLLAQQDVVRQEAANLPGVGQALWHNTKNWLPGTNNRYRAGIKEYADNLKPGEVVKPQSGKQMLIDDTIQNDPGLFDYAKEQGAGAANRIVWQTDAENLSGLKQQYSGANTPLNNAVKQHIAYDPASVKGINDAVAYKTYGAFGVKPGLEKEFTPGNMFTGENATRLLKDHWPKLLAGGGLLAALMYALNGNDDEEDDRRGARGGTTVNNYMGGHGGPQMQGGQPQFSRMPGYYQ